MPATSRHNAPALMAGFNPVAQAATAVRPVDGVASDVTRQHPFQPDAAVRPKARFELRRHPREELPDIVRRSRLVHPRQPPPQVLAIPRHHREQRVGVFPRELF
jgi:hypothetical protein